MLVKVWTVGSPSNLEGQRRPGFSITLRPMNSQRPQSDALGRLMERARSFSSLNYRTRVRQGRHQTVSLWEMALKCSPAWLELRNQQMLPVDQLLQPPVLSRIRLVDRGADHRYDATACTNRRCECLGVDATSQARHNGHPSCNEFTGETARTRDSFWRHVPCADHCHSRVSDQ